MVGEEEVEAGILSRSGSEGLQECPRAAGLREVVGDQPPSRRSACSGLLQVAIIRHHAESARRIERKPGAARLQVSAPENSRRSAAETSRRLAPLMKGRGRTLVELVSIGCDDQAVAGMRLPGEDEEAHGSGAERCKRHG